MGLVEEKRGGGGGDMKTAENRGLTQQHIMLSPLKTIFSKR